MEKKLENLYVIAKCLEEIGGAWFFATYGLFLVSIGLNEWEFVGVNIVFMSVKTLLDPITGNLGDRVGQKKVYLWGIFMWGMGLFVYGFAKTFVVCAVAEAMSGVGAALISEALESWLKNLVSEKAVLRAQSREGFWARLATIPTALVGGWIGAKYGLQWPWFFAGVSTMSACFMIWFMFRNYKDETRAHVFSDADLNLWTITKEAWGDIPTRKVFVLVGIMSACMMPFNMYWQRVLVAANVRQEWMGAMWIGIALFTAFGSRLADKTVPSSKILAIIVAGIGVPMFWPQYLLTVPVLVVLAFLLHEIGRGMINPVLWTYFNRRVQNKTRASKNSLKSAAGSIGAVVGLSVSAVLTSHYSLTQIWAISAVALIGIAFWVIKWNHDN